MNHNVCEVFAVTNELRVRSLEVTAPQLNASWRVTIPPFPSRLRLTELRQTSADSGNVSNDLQVNSAKIAQ